MKRYSVIRILSQALEKSDIGIFIGREISKEAAALNRDGNLYIMDHEQVFSMGLGIAMNTTKRVFIFCDDAYFLKSASEILQIAVSKCKNIFVVVLVSGFYCDNMKFPTIFKSIHSPVGMLFNIGFMIHDYKKHFKNSRNPTKEIKSIWQKVKGPLTVLIDVEIGGKVFLNNDNIEQKSIALISDFIKDNNIVGYNYTPPPIVFNDIVDEE
jgi:hypothetical protein